MSYQDNICSEGHCSDSALQPLREIGTMEKTGFWDIHDVMAALRIANRRGIPLKKLRTPENGESRANCC